MQKNINRQITMNLIILLSLFAIYVNAKDFWATLDGPEGMRVFPMYVSAKNEVLFGTASHGIFRSVDNGQSWQAMNKGIEDKWIINIICIDDSIYIATAYDDYVYRYYNDTEEWRLTGTESKRCYLESALFMCPNGKLLLSENSTDVSVDTGKTWTRSTSCPGARIFCKDSKNNVYAMGSYLYKSTDGGDTWSQVYKPVQTNVYSMEIDSNDDILLGTNYGIIRMKSGIYYEHYILKKWAEFQKIDVAPDGYIFALANNSQIHCSRDNGENWDDISRALPETFFYNIKSDKNGKIYLSSIRGVYTSNDKGETWILENKGIVATYIMAITSTKKYLFALSSETLFRYNKNGLQWDRFYPQGFDINEQSQIVSNSKGELFVSIEYQGVLKSKDNGENWISTSIPTGEATCISIANNDDIFAGTQSGLYCSKNNGSTWNLTRMNEKRINTIWISDRIFFCSIGSSAFQSFDNGNNWTNISWNLPKFSITKIAGDSHGNIYVALRNNNLFKLRPGEKNWIQVYNGLEISKITSIVVNTNDHIFLSTSRDGNFRSKDGGGTWQSSNSGLILPNIICSTIDSDGFLYAGTFQTGVYRTLLSTTLLSLPSQNIDMGSVLFGNTITDSILIKNNGKSQLDISSVISSESAFTVPPTTAQIEPGDSLKLQIQFVPKKAGSHSGMLNIYSNANTSPDAITVTGFANTVILKMNQRYLVLSGLVGDTLRNQTLEITNEGDEILKITKVSVSDSIFSFTIDTTTIMPGNSIHPVITFCPPSFDEYSGFCEIVSNSITSPDTLFFYGAGMIAWLKISSKELNLEATPCESVQDSSLWLTNQGNGQLTIGSIRINDPRFTFIPASQSALPYDTIKTIVTFNPDSVGTFHATCLIYSNSVNSPDAIQITGIGKGILLKANKNILNLSTNFGDSIQDKSITLFNRGSDTLKIQEIHQTNSCFNFSLPKVQILSGESIPTIITFKPDSVGEFSGIFEVISNSISSPDTIFVFGTGLDNTGILSTLEQPCVFALEQNFPNPFNNNTSISFSLPTESLVELKVFNILGEIKQNIFLGKKSLGIHQIKLNGDDLASGIYIYQLKAGNFLARRKLLFLK